MIELLKHVLIVLVPLVLTSTLHMLVVKFKLFSPLKIPIHRHWFGENKTWRGVVFVPIANGIILFLLDSIFELNVPNAFWLGLILGISYLLFELPNSYLKRRMGISAGGSSQQYKYLFYVLDKTDSSFGVTLTYFLITGITLKMAFALFITNSLIHTLVAITLYKLKIKSGF